MIFNQPEDEETNVEQLKRIGEDARWFLIYLICVALGLAALALIGYASAAEAPARSATITFAAPTQYTDGSAIASGTAITYRLYQGEKGQTKTQVATLSTTATTVSTGLQGGKEYCWEVTAVINGQESARSNSACKAFAFPVPETVTITVT